MKEYIEYYQRNKQLDKMYEEKYGSIDNKCYEKNCLELIVEICELCNESKCFKYWTIKKPKMEDVYEELADCITMILTMYYVLDLELDSLKEHHTSSDVLEIINYIYSQGTKLMKDINEDLVKDLLSNLFYLAELLNLDKEEIYKILSYKQDKVEERLNSDY